MVSLINDTSLFLFWAGILMLIFDWRREIAAYLMAAASLLDLLSGYLAGTMDGIQAALLVLSAIGFVLIGILLRRIEVKHVRQ